MSPTRPPNAAAAYPITPATELLEWLSPALAEVGGTLVQAEDELASINMVIGGSYGGVPALTATSGPGLSLMIEALGLAVAAEIPLVVVNVMRVGPSTGIPTKSEQGDLNIALHGLLFAVHFFQAQVPQGRHDGCEKQQHGR